MLSTSNTSNTTSTPAGDVLNTKYLEITNHTFSEDLLFTIVNGTLTNNSNNTINSAEVTVQFYDANGTLDHIFYRKREVHHISTRRKFII